MPNDPWYTRTEFWGTLLTVAKFFVAPPATVLSLIGQGLGAASVMVYTFGRGNVKAQQAAAAAQAAAQALSQASGK